MQKLFVNHPLYIIFASVLIWQKYKINVNQLCSSTATIYFYFRLFCFQFSSPFNQTIFIWSFRFHPKNLLRVLSVPCIDKGGVWRHLFRSDRSFPKNKIKRSGWVGGRGQKRADKYSRWSLSHLYVNLLDIGRF